MSSKQTVFPVWAVLGVVFITLKLCGVINWSWWWVLCPYWAPLAILLAFGLLTLAVLLARELRQ